MNRLSASRKKKEVLDALDRERDTNESNKIVQYFDSAARSMISDVSPNLTNQPRASQQPKPNNSL